MWPRIGVGWLPTGLAMATLLLLPPLAGAQYRSSVEDRLQRLERQLDSNVLVDLIERVDRLQQEIRELRGEAEQQVSATSDLSRRQKELFLDLDRRLKRLETGASAEGGAPMTAAPAAAGPAGARPAPGAATPAGAQAGAATPAATGAPAGGSAAGAKTPPAASSAAPAAGGALPAGSPATASPPAGDPLKEQAAYQQAFNLLKEGQYEQATKGFTTFLKTYPSGRYADNAQYWLGESYYVNRQLQPALSEFKKLLQAHPDSAKVSHAKLKIGLIYSETGEVEQAKKVLTEVVTKYPNTPQARLAQERIQRLAE